MFESINKSSFTKDEDVEDANFFLDHFHTTAELRLKLNDPWNSSETFWGSGECTETPFRKTSRKGTMANGNLTPL